MKTIFKNRQEAGQQLIQKLFQFKDAPKLIIVGLPASIDAASVVAQELGGRLTIKVPRAIRSPNYDFLLGAATDDSVIFDERNIARADQKLSEVSDSAQKTINAAKSEQDRYLKDLPKVNFTNANVIVVDDGIAHPFFLRAIGQSIKKQNPHTLILACPVLYNEIVDACTGLFDDIINLVMVDAAKDVRDCYESLSALDEAQIRGFLTK